MNYLDILVRASIDVTAATENIKLPNAGTQVRGPRASFSSEQISLLHPVPVAWGCAALELTSLTALSSPLRRKQMVS